MQYNVNEIFHSIEGEGKRTGQLTTFVRLAGCNLNCSYCDTEYAKKQTDGNLMSLEDIVGAVRYRNVTLTGGEPLFRPNAEALIRRLLEEDLQVNIETNGSVDLWELSAYKWKDLFFTMDYKTPSSGMHEKMVDSNLDVLTAKDVIKFVVGSREDLDFVWDLLDVNQVRAKKFISPVFGKIEPAEIVQYMKDNEMDDCIFQLQMHKLIWPPQTRGV